MTGGQSEAKSLKISAQDPRIPLRTARLSFQGRPWASLPAGWQRNERLKNIPLIVGQVTGVTLVRCAHPYKLDQASLAWQVAQNLF